MFHAFTGCDTDSCFSGRGKRTAWDIWNMYPETTGQFASLMKKPQLGDVDAAMDTIERFGVLLYDKTNTESEVNMVRFEIFARKCRVRQQYSTDEECASSACEESSISGWALLEPGNRTTYRASTASRMGLGGHWWREVGRCVE